MTRGLLFFVMSALLVGCGSAPNASATQTRTSEIVELTVSARLLPTANPAIPPTPVPVVSTPSFVASSTPAKIQVGSATSVSTATDTPARATVEAMLDQFRSPSTPSSGYGAATAPWEIPITAANQQMMYGSWVAFAPNLRVRFFAPPSLVDAPEFNNDRRYSLASPSNIYDFEALDIHRFVGARGGDFAKTWQSEMDAFSRGRNVGVLSVTSGPRQLQVASYQGNVGQFHYGQLDNNLEISGTMWVGQVGGDEVVIVYRCTPEREASLDQEFAQVIATVDFNAR